MMTMLSMLTSQKKTKFIKILGITLGFCCLISLTGCSSSEKNDEPKQPTSNNVQSGSNEYSNTKVKTTMQTPLFILDNEKLVDAGLLEPNVYLDIAEGDAIQGAIPLKDTGWYVKQSDVTNDGRWFKNQTHLVPFAEAITTNSTYRIEDDFGNLLGTSSSSNIYQVYVKPSSEDPRYGVLIQNKIYFIPQSDVMEVMERAVETPVPELATSIPVMMYHFFYDESKGETRKDVNYIEVNELREQADYLVNNGFVSLTMREIEYFMEERAQVPVNSYGFTIDDGHESVYQYAYPILKEYGINATMFIIGGWMETTLTYELWEMREEGIELQSHSFLMHQGGCKGMGHGGRLLCVGHDEGVADTVQSYEYVDNGFVYCYPFGDVNDNAIAIMKDSGTKLAFTTEFGKIQQGMDVLKLPRIRVTGGAGINQYINHLN
ncbi:MAG: polysaccharide deacetylase family protein [Anaerorhabdus sp.]